MTTPLSTTTEPTDARALMDTYYILFHGEASANKWHLHRNPRIDPMAFWADVERTFFNWLKGLHEDPSRALSGTTNWKGKVTKAYFTMKGLLTPKTKKMMVATYLTFFAPSATTEKSCQRPRST
jgi:hypothetical protein